MFIAGDSRGFDGLPAFQLHAGMHRNAVAPMNWAVAHQRLGAPGRGLIAAVAHDLEGVTLAPQEPLATGPDGKPFEGISVSRMLGLNDHRGFTRDGIVIGDPRRAREYLRRGRRLMAAVGGWPWTHASADGRLPTDWRARREYIEPIEKWHEQALQETRELVQASSRAARRLG